MDAYDASGKSNVLFFEPESLHLVTDTTHPLYDERVHLPLNEAVILNIMELGVATDAYANAMQQRANDIHQNLGLLESAWDSLGITAKGAWDAMLNIGREQTLTDKLATLNENIAEAQKGQKDGGFWNSFSARFTNLPEMIKQRDLLESVANLQGDVTKGQAKAKEAEQQRIKTQQEADRVNQQYLSNADKRNKAIKQQSEFLKAGAITAEQYAKMFLALTRCTKIRNHPRRQRVKHIPRTQQPGCLIR
ncbi:hypothetical protein LNO81_13235 [Klebsiella variicola subsp. variicola]|nr:hypothetical protein [Klebsiella variicola subsp. variicola]